MRRKYLLKADPHDSRDRVLLHLSLVEPATLPAAVDLQPFCPIVYDQGTLGSCSGNAIGGAVHFEILKRARASLFAPSRLFIYFNERVTEGTVNVDSGACLRDGMKSVAKQGVCDETEWPYDINRFAEKPPEPCYINALNHQVLSYFRLYQTLPLLKSCLAEGHPFVCGIQVYESFESDAVARSGVVPLPDTMKERCLGGHAVMIVGYDDARCAFKLRNSWGAGWGLGGYCWIPYAYLTDPRLSMDCWTIRQVEVPDVSMAAVRDAAPGLPQPYIQPVPDTRNYLVAPQRWEIHLPWSNRLLTILPGFGTDGASIPQLLWSFGLDPFNPSFVAAAIPHDALYAAQLLPRHDCDKELFHLMQLNGATGAAYARKFFIAVDTAGGSVWDAHTPGTIAAARQFCMLGP